MEPIEELVNNWLSTDRDEVTKQEIRELAQDGNTCELERRLRKRIAFGTAGLRGKMEAGFSRMNSLTVLQATQGLAAFVLENWRSEDEERSIVIGHDARRNSAKFARLTARACACKGLKVYLFEKPVHTPLVPYLVGLKKASAGVVITASHNPKDDNGYKVYWSNASQIIPPIDSGIAASISRNLVPWFKFDCDTTESDQGFQVVSDEDQLSYYNRIADVVAPLLNDTRHVPSFVYTPMHGVGLAGFLAARDAICQRMGMEDIYPRIRCVPEQAAPDQDFPTVKFPNPEEKGALNLAITYADELSVDLVIATDPDADRFALVEKLKDGSWYQFTGNEVGVLLASVFLDDASTDSLSQMTLLNTAVSSRMLKVMAESKGASHEETLTGFKWLGNRAQALIHEGRVVPYAYEEAIGYMFTDVVCDKDGIAAACIFLAAAARWKAVAGIGPYEKLQQLYAQYGFFGDANTYLISPDARTTNAVFAQIRDTFTDSSRPYPETLGDRRVLSWRDLTIGYDSSTTDGKPVLPVDPNSQMITFELERRTKVTMRGSGTEPKIKLYIESQAVTKEEANSEANEVLHDIIQAWLKPDQNGLLRP